MSSPAPEGAERSHAPRADTPTALARLSLGALGVVYGDIGTSPLYALKECFAPEHGLVVTPMNVLGVLSLVVWAMILVVVLKYLSFIMRADNHGEGGILALFALVLPRSATDSQGRGTRILMILGLFGAALLYGDGMITPAISVLGAVEGLGVATKGLNAYVVPITVVILIGLFSLQRRGTSGIGAVFGPAMLVWFFAITCLGARAIAERPDVVTAINPLHAVRFMLHHGWHGFLILGSVVLVITGGEALYADMGHFGRRPIRLAWYLIAMPALITNYFGQGAILLTTAGKAASNPFYALADGWLLYPMVGIATCAAIIASQALISGVFSLTQQAVQLGYWPRVHIVHTSGEAAGQIYIPDINQSLMVACVALVIGFKHSSGLAAAYGIAVTGTMAITTLLFYRVARDRWLWGKLPARLLAGLFLFVDLAFFGANASKIVAGGWFPLVMGGFVFTIMVTWRRGRAELSQLLAASTLPIDLFMEDVGRTKPMRVPGTAAFLTSIGDRVPPVLLHHYKHTKVLHEQVLFLSVITEDVPAVPGRDRVIIEDLGHGFWRVTGRYGFIQSPNVLDVIRRANRAGLRTSTNDTSYYLGRETLLTTGKSTMARWRKRLFAYLSRNSHSPTAFFGLPPNRVVEIGAQIEI